MSLSTLSVRFGYGSPRPLVVVPFSFGFASCGSSWLAHTHACAVPPSFHPSGGVEKVAELTGRKGRLVKTAEGTVKYEARNATNAASMEMQNMHEKAEFMDGKKFVAIISEAASQGISLQADKRVKNQRPRVHLTLELPWSADKAVQQLGRTHRSNQSSGPAYKFLLSGVRR